MRDVIELLAPARDYATGVAAIDCGADAVYIGAPVFGARYAAGNPIADIERLVQYARIFGVRVYVTLNTVLFDSELELARQTACDAIRAGADALIVQDFAYLRMGLSGVEMHASTQMSNCSAEWVDFLSRCGFSRVILERNLSIRQIRDIAVRTDVDLECFVHGAVCVGYSGRCFMSRSMGPRSANRGECSQPCRLTYDLVDKAGRVIVKGKHLLSVQDLNLGDRIEQLIDAGVTSFKIEGRLKDELYVRNTVSYYRAVIDGALAVRPHLRRSSSGVSQACFQPDAGKGFTRVQGHYLFDGPRSGVATLDTPKSVGQRIGRVTACGPDWFETDSDVQLTAADGICFMSGGELCGTNINRTDGIRLWPNRMDGIETGVEIFRNFDSLFAGQVLKGGCTRRLDVALSVAMDSESIEIIAVDCDGMQVTRRVEMHFEKAENESKMRSAIVSQLSKSGNTVFRVTEVKILSEIMFIPISVLNSLRREVLEHLTSARRNAVPQRRLKKENPDVRYPFGEVGADENVTNRLSREFYISHGADRIAPALETARSLGGCRVMTTRYCIRRETGLCLKRTDSVPGELYLVHGAMRYRLEFDCRRCMMNVYLDEKNRCR